MVHSEIPVHYTSFRKNYKSRLRCTFSDCSHFGSIGCHFPMSKACHTVTNENSYVRSTEIPLWVEGCVHPKGMASAASSRDFELVKPAGLHLLKKSPAGQICSTLKFPSSTRFFPSNIRLFPSFTRLSRSIHIFPHLSLQLRRF